MAKGKRTGGRKPGTPNKLTLDVRRTIMEVFERLGGTKRMAEWAEENPSDFYKHIYSKIIPRVAEVSGPQGAPIEIAQEVRQACAQLPKADLDALRKLAEKARKRAKK